MLAYAKSMKALREKREKARALRAQGYSIKEIVKNLDAVKSTISVWVRDVPLSISAKQRLLTRVKRGQFISAENNRVRTRAKEVRYLSVVKGRLQDVIFEGDSAAFLCAAMYWCEGAKGLKTGVSFMNSDPDLMRKFLVFFRRSFDLNEAKFRPLLHLHEYHDSQLEIAFWSKITKIKPEQFSRPYLKPHTGKRVREGYHVCLSLRYYDNDIARQLLALGKALIGKT